MLPWLPSLPWLRIIMLCGIVGRSIGDDSAVEGKRKLHIGVLYHSRNMSSYLTPFNLAIQDANSNPNILPNVQLEPIETLIENYYASPFIVQLQVCRMLQEHPMVALVGPYHYMQTKAVSLITSALGIPNISPTASGTFLEDPLWQRYMFHLNPIDSAQVAAIFDILMMLELKDSQIALINTDDTYGYTLSAKFEVDAHKQRMLIKDHVIISANAFTGTVDIRGELQRIKKKRIRIFVLFVKSSLIDPVLKQAHELGLVGPEYLWISGSSAVDDLDDRRNSQAMYYDGLLLLGRIETGNTDTPQYRQLVRALEEARGTRINRLDSLSAQVYDSTTALIRALDLLGRQGKLTFEDPVVECDLEDPSDFETTETEEGDDRGIERRKLRRGKRSEKGDYTIPVMRKFGEGGLIAQAMKEISFDGVSGKNISFSSSGGPTKNTYTIVNVRAGVPVDIGKFEEATGIGLPLRSRPQFYGGDTKIKTTISTHLKLGVVKDPPFVKYTYEETGHTKCPFKDQLRCYEGLSIDIIEKLARQYDFTYTLVEEPSGKFGAPTSENEEDWDGLIGMLKRREIDIGIVAFGINTARERVVDFAVPLLSGGVVMVTQEGGPVGADGGFDPLTMFRTDSFFFLRPFSKELWIAIVLAGCVFCVLIWIFDHFSPYGYYGGTKQKLMCCKCEQCTSSLNGDFSVKGCPFGEQQSIQSEMKGLNLLNSVWLIVCSFLQIGPPDAVPKCWSTRVLITAWWIICLVLISLYTANLAAYLTVTRIQKNIETVEDLLQSGMSCGTAEGTITDMLLKNTSDQQIASLVRRMENVGSYEEGIEQTRQGGYAFLYGSAPLQYTSNMEPCGLKVSSHSLIEYELAFALPDESPLMELINKGLITMKEKNEILPAWRNWIAGPCTGKLATKPGSSEINVYSVVGTMAIILPVVALSILVFALEFMKGRRSPNRNPALKKVLEELIQRNEEEKPKNYSVSNRFVKLINDRPSHEIRKLLAKTKKESGTSITSNLHNRKNSEKPTTADVEAAKAGAAENLEGKDRPDFELFDINSEVMKSPQEAIHPFKRAVEMAEKSNSSNITRDT